MLLHIHCTHSLSPRESREWRHRTGCHTHRHHLLHLLHLVHHLHLLSHHHLIHRHDIASTHTHIHHAHCRCLWRYGATTNDRAFHHRILGNSIDLGLNAVVLWVAGLSIHPVVRPESAAADTLQKSPPARCARSRRRTLSILIPHCAGSVWKIRYLPHFVGSWLAG